MSSVQEPHTLGHFVSDTRGIHHPPAAKCSARLAGPRLSEETPAGGMTVKAFLSCPHTE